MVTRLSDHFIIHINKSLCTAETYTLFPIDYLQLTEVQIVLEKKNWTAIWSSNSILEIDPKETETCNSKRYLHPLVHSIISKSQDTEST